MIEHPHPDEQPRTLLEDMRLIFATILTDPGSSLAYGADALVHITIALVVASYSVGLVVTLAGGAFIMLVYLAAILVYNSMTLHHTHNELGGGAYVSALITSQRIRRHPRVKKLMQFLGKSGTASLLSDFPATQAISLIAGVEALFFIPVNERLKWAFGFLIFISFIQRFGLGNLARFLIWPVLAFYASNIAINATGIITILMNGWKPPEIGSEVHAGNAALYLPILLSAVANGATLITGVEVGYSSVNIPYNKGRAIRASMWTLYGIVLVTYSMQLINFLGLGVHYQDFIPLPIQIAKAVGGDLVAVPFGVLTATMLLLAAQTAQTDFPLEILRASRSNFFPRGIGDMAWKKTTPAGSIGGHGVYNPRATLILGGMTVIILYFFPSSHHIEGMYGLAVILAMNIDVASYTLRQLRARKFSIITLLAGLVFFFMLGNILYNKFFEGAWFILVLLTLYLILFLFSEAIYSLWREKMNLVPLELGLAYPAFQNMVVDRSNIMLVSKFHPGVVHFLKNYVKSGHIPLLVHFQTEAGERPPDYIPPWYESVPVGPDTDTISAIKEYVQKHKPARVHLIPMLVRGIDSVNKLYFGNSIDRLKYALSEFADVQVEFNRERVEIQFKDIMRRIFPRKTKRAAA